MNPIQRISNYLADADNLPRAYAIIICVIAIIGLCSVPLLNYHEDQLYPKTLNPESPLYPYDRGGIPFEEPGVIIAQYPENAPKLGYVTSYLTPAAILLSETTNHLGTTIVAHPGGILDEILYYTRGLDTIVEASIFFVAFTIAAFLYRRKDE